MSFRTLITGGTGTFGQAMTRYLLKNTHDTICIFSRDEHKQERMARDLQEYSARLRFFIGDIRDKERINKGLRNVVRVFHAAALKIIPSCEYNVDEAIATNVQGTQNIVDLCAKSETVKRFLLISTDKAVMPINAYGMTKALAEKIVTNAPYNYGNPACIFGAIRLGNVIGSNGSVIPLFQKLTNEGKEIELTDLAMTRFFISINSLVKFAYSTIKMIQPGETIIPVMKKIRIAQLAEYFGKTKIIGIRPGEKIHEDLIAAHEVNRTWLGSDGYTIVPLWANEEYSGEKIIPIKSNTVEDWDINELIAEALNDQSTIRAA